MVFQESALFDSMTVRENVAYRAYEEGQDETEIEGKVEKTLGFVGLEDAIEKISFGVVGRNETPGCTCPRSNQRTGDHAL